MTIDTFPPAAPDTADRRIAHLAGDRHGVVCRADLLSAGIASHLIRDRVRAGLLMRLHAGVYRVGPVVSPRASEIAAVLACTGGRFGGERVAAISHRSAAALLGFPRFADAAHVELTLVGFDRGRRPGLRVYRAHRLPADEITTIEGIPVTTAARTLLDLARVLSSRDLERALAFAERASLVTRAELHVLLERHPRRRGTGRLRRLLLTDAPAALTRSEAEERLLALIRKAMLPAPEVNAILEGMEVDFLWRSHRLVVEVDGFAFHSSAGAFEADRLRDGRLAAAGYRVIRVTWRQIVTEPEATIVRIGQALAQ